MITFDPRLNHAINFAARHHDGQRRKGRDVPYITHPFYVALILARHNRPIEELMAAVLHDVVEDCAPDDNAARLLKDKIRDKFGVDVSNIVWGVTERKRDQNEKLPPHTRKNLYLGRIADACEGSKWVCAADKIHNGSSVVLDLLHAADRDAVWSTFSGGKQMVTWWYREVHTTLRRSGFQGDIMGELDHVATMIEAAAITHEATLPHGTPR